MPPDRRAAAMGAIARKLGVEPAQLAAIDAEAEDRGASASAEEAPSGEAPPIGDGVVEERFLVSGLHCPSCAWLVEHALEEHEGVSRARVDFLTEVATVRLDLRSTSREAAARVLEPLGYQAQLLGEVEGDPDPERLAFRFGVAGVAAMNAMMLAWVHYAELFGGHAGDWKGIIGGLGAVISVPAVVYSGAPIFRRALGLLRRRRIAMETLLALGIGASLFLSLVAFVLPGANFYFEVPTMIVSAALASRLVDRAIRRSSARRVSALLKPRALKVRLDASGDAAGTRFAEVEELRPGDRIVVPEGEETPADVAVLDGGDGRGTVSVSEAVLSGEPTPLWKRPGSTVLAGSVVVRGVLRGEVLRPPAESAHAQVGQQILEVLQGQGERTEAADRVAAWFVAFIVVGSLGTLLVHAFALGHGLTAAAAWLPAIAVLVVACPCAFSIAASASMGTAAMRLLGDGVLLRDPNALEAAAKVDTAVFDKTGTLTAGDVDVRALEWLGEPAPASLAAVAGLEAHSRHPLAAAIRRYIQAKEVPRAEVEDVEEIPGLGVRGIAGGVEFAVGAPALFGEPAPELAAASTGGSTAVLFGPVDAPAGAFLCDDPIRSGAAAAVDALRELGVEARLLSGDDGTVVARCAEAVGIDHHEGRALPADKAARMGSLRGEGRRVLYVGDGVNDGPALAAADVGIAMRHGASMALEAAGLLAIRDDPGAAAITVRLARKLRRVTLQNYTWAIGYNVALVPVAASGLLHPAFAALAMLLSSVTVLANSARLLRKTGR